MKNYFLLTTLSAASYQSTFSAPIRSGGVQTSCLLVADTAVYRARSIWSTWAPNAVFDDRLLCIQGQNKNQDRSNLDIDSLIENQIKETITQQQPQQTVQSNTAQSTFQITHMGNIAFKLYPNPADKYLIIEYHAESDGELILYNNVGQIVLKIY